jgi:hypothetical protein
MITITTFDLLLIIIFTLLTLGVVSTLIGIFILVFKATGKEVQTLATQTAKLAQKGIAEDVAGLVGNASSLLDATNQLVRNTAGIGVFMILLGIAMIIASGLLTLQLF